MRASNELRRSSALDVLTKDNYKTWRMQAEALLRVNRLWDHVEEEKESVLNLDGRKLWMKMDKLAKSELILCISSSLLPLIENCTTAREVWLKLADVYANEGARREDSIKNTDTDDEDTIINEIESCVDDFFETINNSSVQKILEIKKSLTTTFTHKLFSRLKIHCVKNLPDEKIIVNTVGDFIDEIDKLSRFQIKELTNELSSELIDVLLSEFNIDPNKNDDDEANSDADGVETRDNDIDGGVKRDKIRELSELLPYLREPIPNDAPGNYDESLRSESECDYGSIPCNQSYDQQEDCSTETSSALMNLCTPPSTPTRKPRKCGICREEGHNRTTCPMNKPAVSARRSTETSPALMNLCTPRSTPVKKSRKCGVCREEGHNRTTCPMKNSTASARRSTETSPSSINLCAPLSTPVKKPRKCGVCREEGHNRTTCPMKNSATSARRSTETSPPSMNLCAPLSTPVKKPRKCGVCREEGHNRITCPLNKSIAMSRLGNERITRSLNKSAASASNSTSEIAEKSRSYKCGVCGVQGHNRTKCPLNKPTASASKYYTTQAPETSRRPYKCGGCGNEGHNIRSCPSLRSQISSPEPAVPVKTARSYRCKSCGQEGHNSRTCGNRRISSSSYSAPVYSSYSKPASKRAAYRCGNCGEEGHNSRTCGHRGGSSSSYSTPSYSSYSAPAPSYSGGGRSYKCGNCGRSGHNRRTCSG